MISYSNYYYFVEGGVSPCRKEVKNASELLGLKQGTAWPAPLNVANVSPWYSSYHPLTCFQGGTYH